MLVLKRQTRIVENRLQALKLFCLRFASELMRGRPGIGERRDHSRCQAHRSADPSSNQASRRCVHWQKVAAVQFKKARRHPSIKG